MHKTPKRVHKSENTSKDDIAGPTWGKNNNEDNSNTNNHNKAHENKVKGNNHVEEV